MFFIWSGINFSENPLSKLIKELFHALKSPVFSLFQSTWIIIIQSMNIFFNFWDLHTSISFKCKKLLLKVVFNKEIENFKYSPGAICGDLEIRAQTWIILLTYKALNSNYFLYFASHNTFTTMFHIYHIHVQHIPSDRLITIAQWILHQFSMTAVRAWLPVLSWPPSFQKHPLV